MQNSGSNPSNANAAFVEKLVEKHQDYVRALARKISIDLPKNVDFEELVAFGQIGLVEAAQKFQPGLGVGFSTYSYYRIRGSIFDGLRKMAWLPPQKTKKVTQMAAVDAIAENTTTDFGPNPDVDAVAHEFGETVRRVGAVFLLSDVTDSNDEDGSNEPADTRPNGTHDVEQRELVEKLRGALADMEERQATLLQGFYFKNKSMTDIARDMKVNKSTISRLHKEAVDALRRAMGG